MHCAAACEYWLPSAEDISQKKAVEALGYSYIPGLPWVSTSFNFTNQAVGPLFKQLYFRTPVSRESVSLDSSTTGSINQRAIAHCTPVPPKVRSIRASWGRSRESRPSSTAGPWYPGTAAPNLERGPGGPAQTSRQIRTPASISSYLGGSTQVSSEMESMYSTMKEEADI